MNRPARYFLLMPLLGLIILAGAVVDMSYRPRASDALAYHQSIHDAAQKLPGDIGGWEWQKDVVLPDTAATKLLKPNVLIQRQYKRSDGRTMSFLLDQCPDARDMNGHYPPNCYVGIGMVLASQQPVTLEMKNHDATVPVSAMEYTFENKITNSRMLVLNFIILPSHRFATDIDEVERAAANFSQRFFGAAQVQFIISLPPSIDGDELETLRNEHRQAAETFLAGMSDLIMLIYSGPGGHS